MIDGILIYEGNKPLLLFPINGADAPHLQRQIAECNPTLQRADWRAPLLVSASQALLVKQVRELLFVASVSTSASPLLAENLVDRVVEVIELYFRTPVSSTLVTEKRAEILLILSEMMDIGLPRITEPNIIEHLLYTDGLLAQLLAQAANPAAAAQATLNGNHNQISSVPDKLVPWEKPWRRPRVKHLKEELFVDIIEHVRCARPHKPLAKVGRFQISGEVLVTSRLNDIPHPITLDLSLPIKKTQLQLHACVDQTTNLPNHFAFFPPDERSCIAQYSLSTPDPGLLQVGLARHREWFEISLSTAIDVKVEHLENLLVAIVFPPRTKSVREISATCGDLDVSDPQRCVYHLGKTVMMGWKALLKAQGLNASGQTVSPLYIEVQYELTGKVASSATVRSIGIPPSRSRNVAPPFKGVRYQTKVESYIVA